MKKCFKKIVLKINTAKTSDNIAFFLCMTVLLSIMMTFIVVLNYRGVSYQVFQSPANISATFYNVLSPFIAIVAAALTFMAFWTQYKANQKMLKNNAKQEVERQFYEMLRIHKENVNELKWEHWSIKESSSPDLKNNTEANNKYAFKQIRGRKVFHYHDLEWHGVVFCLEDAIKTVFGEEYFNRCVSDLGKYRTLLSFTYKVFFEGMNTIRWYFNDATDSFFNDCDNKFDEINDYFNQHKSLKFDNYHVEKECLFDDVDGRIYLYLYFYLNRFKHDFSVCSTKSEFERELCGYDFFNGHVYDLNHYYRHLYQMVKIIASYDDRIVKYNEKRKYLRMLRAQLTSDEQKMLFYNWLSGYGSDWENEKNHFFTTYRMIHNMELNGNIIFRNIDYDEIVKMIKKENLGYKEYENDYLFEFEEKKLINMRHVYDRIRNEKDVFSYDDLLPSKIENIIGRKRFFNINNYVVITYYKIIYVGRMEKDDYETAIKDIQKHITQMFIWED